MDLSSLLGGLGGGGGQPKSSAVAVTTTGAGGVLGLDLNQALPLLIAGLGGLVLIGLLGVFLLRK
jgi:hypothetical protein